MSQLPGAYKAKKKDGTIYYRASFTYKRKHISLGSFSTESMAHKAYLEAIMLRDNTTITLSHYRSNHILSFEKWISLLNFRDNNIYIKNPIYLHKYYFSYYLQQDFELKFDIDDLFYYSNHKIFKKGNYLFVNDYGMQINIISRYGIKNHAVINKDYRFMDGDPYNFRYHNIKIINQYYGVSKEISEEKTSYVAKININGQYIIGYYATEEKAAIAYNKIADFLNNENISDKTYSRNYIIEMSPITYSEIYNKIRIHKKFIDLKGIS